MIGGLGFSTYYSVTKYLSLKSQSSNQTFIVTTNLSYYLSLSTTWLVFACISGILLLIVLLLIIVLVKRVRLAIALIGEASRAVTAIFTSLIFPILPLALQIGFLAYFLTVAVILALSGENIFKVANVTTSTNLTNGSILQIGDTCDPNNILNAQNGIVCVFHRYFFNEDYFIIRNA